MKQDYFNKKLYKTIEDKETLELNEQLNQIYNNLYGTGIPEVDMAILDDDVNDIRKIVRKKIENGNKNN